MPIAPIPPIGSAPVGPIGGPASAGAAKPAGPGFAEAIERGLQQVSGLEKGADSLTQSIASGGPGQIHELMIAGTKAQLGVDLLVQVRNKAVEAYQEIMRLQV